MNKLSLSFIGTLVLATALPAVAGPDWQTIEYARRAKQSASAERHADPYAAAGPAAAGLKCPPDRPRWLLDHGPRAEGSPDLNRRRQARYEEALRACEAARR